MSEHTRTLLLWRHAKSAWDEPQLPDIERPLAPRGLKAAPAMAAWLQRRWQPDLVICSPARRTVQTLAALKLPATIPVHHDNRIYEAAWPALLAVLRETEQAAGTVLLVGHNPGLTDLTRTLTGVDPGKFPTAACAVLAIEAAWRNLGPGGARLSHFQRPKALRPC